MNALDQENTSIWEGTSPNPKPYPALAKDISVDVAVIGAGITGLTAAYYLAQQGKSVAVLEANCVGSGTTGKTTAHLTTLFDHSYDTLEKKYGVESSRLVARSLQESIDRMEALQSQLGIACDFERLSGFYYTEEESHMSDVDKVRTASNRAGLDVTTVNEVPLPYATVDGFEIKNQAQMHSLSYLHGLAEAATSCGAQIYENTRALAVDSGKPCKIRTPDASVTATDVFMATHTPIGFNLLQSELAPYRSYVVAAKIRSEVPHGLFWDTCEPYHYIRRQMTDEGPLLIVGGKDRKVGHGGEEEAFARLQEYCQKRFDVDTFVYQWSAQYYDPADHLPYIGLIPFSEHIYTGTGYSGDGMTFGSLAGFMVAEQISGRDTPYDKIYQPARINTEGLPTFIRENLDVAKGLVIDRFLPAASRNLDSLPVGDGRVFRSGISKYAAFRKSEKEVAVFSAVCPHMRCIVRWNNVQKSFDCPCHGSRFDTDGSVIEGPSLQCLSPINRAAEQEEPKEKTKRRQHH